MFCVINDPRDELLILKAEDVVIWPEQDICHLTQTFPERGNYLICRHAMVFLTSYKSVSVL